MLVSMQEIGYTDTIIDVRSNRVRTLLGLNHTSSNEDSLVDQAKAAAQAKQQRRPNQVAPSSAIVADTESSVLATFEFLNDQRDGGTMNVRNPSSADEDEEIEEDEDDMVEDGEGSFCR